MSLTDVKRYSTFPEWTEKVNEFCCICLTPFATTTFKRKRKKFHGASCENSARKILTEEILNELISISQTTLPLSSSDT